MQIMKGRTILRVVALSLCALVLAWQHFNNAGPAGGARLLSQTRPAAVSSAPTAQSPPPRHWQLGTLSLGACELPH